MGVRVVEIDDVYGERMKGVWRDDESGYLGSAVGGAEEECLDWVLEIVVWRRTSPLVFAGVFERALGMSARSGREDKVSGEDRLSSEFRVSRGQSEFIVVTVS